MAPNAFNEVLLTSSSCPEIDEQQEIELIQELSESLQKASTQKEGQLGAQLQNLISQVVEIQNNLVEVSKASTAQIPNRKKAEMLTELHWRLNDLKLEIKAFQSLYVASRNQIKALKYQIDRHHFSV